MRLQQICNNLIGNAIKFTETGTIRCEAYKLPSDNPYVARVLFSVSDTGIGIEEDKLGKLFNAFTQVSEGFERSCQGAGLGLAIVRDLVTLMGGTIAVVSEPGVGSTFYFCLPFKLAQAHPAPDGYRDTATVHMQSAYPVLLVEDDTVSALAISAFLKKSGIRVGVVGDGQQALRELAHGDYSLVLMDVQMPVMGGIEATERIRSGEAGEQNRSIPIIAMTAYAMAGDKEHFLDTGMDDYIAKPVDMKELCEVMDRMLRKGGCSKGTVVRQ